MPIIFILFLTDYCEGRKMETKEKEITENTLISEEEWLRMLGMQAYKGSKKREIEMKIVQETSLQTGILPSSLPTPLSCLELTTYEEARRSGKGRLNRKQVGQFAQETSISTSPLPLPPPLPLPLSLHPQILKS